MEENRLATRYSFDDLVGEMLESDLKAAKILAGKSVEVGRNSAAEMGHTN